MNEYFEGETGGKVGSTTGIGIVLSSPDSKGEVKIRGFAVGDVSATVIDAKNKKVTPLYAVKGRKNTSDSGGEFTAVRAALVGLDDDPGYVEGTQPTPIEMTVKEGQFIVLASDSLYDNLPGDSDEDKQQALLAIMQNPKYDAPRDQRSTMELPSLEELQSKEPKEPKSEEEATRRISNYMHATMPTEDVEIWTSETTFATLPGETMADKKKAREAIMRNPQFDTPQGEKQNELPSPESLKAETPTSSVTKKQAIQRVANYRDMFSGSLSNLKAEQKNLGLSFPQKGRKGKLDDIILVVKRVKA